MLDIEAAEPTDFRGGTVETSGVVEPEEGLYCISGEIWSEEKEGGIGVWLTKLYFFEDDGSGGRCRCCGWYCG
jgi:hypothetical protein